MDIELMVRLPQRVFPISWLGWIIEILKRLRHPHLAMILQIHVLDHYGAGAMCQFVVASLYTDSNNIIHRQES